MANETSHLKHALIAHKAKLEIIDALSKTTTEQMQQILAVDLEAFDKRLNTWATAAPLHKIIALYDAQDKQP